MKVFICMPAYNTARTVEKTLRALPKHLQKHVLLGDNQSTDGTPDVAEKLGITVLRHDKNYGYGGNLKRLYDHALEQGADVVVELHSDYQYEPRVVDLMVEFIRRGYFEVMQGNRIRSRNECLSGGMSKIRYFGNRFLTFFENLWFGITFGEWHTGLKVFRADVLRRLPYGEYPNSHAFANDILMDCVKDGYRVGEIPIPTRYEPDSSSTTLWQNITYVAGIVWASLVRPPWNRKKNGSVKFAPFEDGEINGHPIPFDPPEVARARTEISRGPELSPTV